ncbi:NADPH-dependent F420 reductase [SAR202 cluster bacterium AC-647-N09_OGT_505m]|nr:NADPH-dependent F420 reductase [SAR202 cluster bacterium AC-647-N09_OGT_505m]
MLGFLGGTGPEGKGLALRLGLAGEPFIIGSRDSARADETARELRALGNLTEVYSGPNEEVAQSADVVFITAPYSAQRDLLEALRGQLDGKVVVDTVVPLAYSRGQFSIVKIEEGSAALQAQAILIGSKIVAAFQTISAHDLLDLTTSVEGDVVTCADDEEARESVMTLAKRIPSLRAINGGALENSRYVEGITALLLNINRIYKSRSSIRVAGI